MIYFIRLLILTVVSASHIYKETTKEYHIFLVKNMDISTFLIRLRFKGVGHETQYLYYLIPSLKLKQSSTFLYNCLNVKNVDFCF